MQSEGLRGHDGGGASGADDDHLAADRGQKQGALQQGRGLEVWSFGELVASLGSCSFIVTARVFGGLGCEVERPVGE